MDLSHIFNDIEFNTYDKINIIEIGTGIGQNSTKFIYDYFTSFGKPFTINSYEGDNGNYQVAHKYWNSLDSNVKIINKYVSNKEDIKTLLIPNLPSYIKDYKETSVRFAEKYTKVYNNENNDYIDKFNIEPNLIFIDCSRFMHLPIINKCYELSHNTDTDTDTDNAKSCIYVIEDDYFVDGEYGELNIISKHFKLKNVKKYEKTDWQWPFVVFEIESKY